MGQQETPVFDGLLNYVRRQGRSFHVPGHKDGRLIPERGRELYRQLMAIDATELPGLDDLYHAQGMLRDGETLLSHYYGTRASFFLVNGSTVGNLVMIMSSLHPGDCALVQRDCHKSVFNGLRLARAEPVFISPCIDTDSGLSIGLSETELEQAVSRFPQAKALILTYPTYYGVAGPLAPLVACAHAHDLLVIVDEAHGPHFHLGSPLPADALNCGADLVVQSAHKMLPAMTMGAWLHVNSDRVKVERIAAMRAMLQTSSPSYPIMASLDLARFFLAGFTQADLNDAVDSCMRLATAFDRLEGVHVLKAVSGHFQLDPFKITLVLERGNGYALYRRLSALGMYPEMAERSHVLFTLGVEVQKHAEAVPLIARALHEQEEQDSDRAVFSIAFPAVSCLACSYDELENKRRVIVDFEWAAGQICAEDIVPYPPGIPLIANGERISHDSLQMVERLLASGASFQNEHVTNHQLTIYSDGIS
ncbi:MAG: aminotransferase class I/II-fold pyridoxal phosphate-dependent enzyme [Sporolactobacillus sp.]